MSLEGETVSERVQLDVVGHREDDQIAVVPRAIGVFISVEESCVSCLDCLLPGCQIGSDDDVQALDLRFSHVLTSFLFLVWLPLDAWLS